MAHDTKERKWAEAQFKKEERATEGAKAMSEYKAEREAERAKTERLKALRLAKEASDEERAQSGRDPDDAAPRRLDRLPPRVIPVQFQQVEGLQECLRLVPPVPEQMEGGQPPLVTPTSPSIRHERILRWFMASTMSG